MITTLTPYPEYKDTGLPWLGQMPEHWESRRLRHACEMRVSNVDKHTRAGETPVRLCNYVEVYKNERISQSTRFMVATATEDERKRFAIRKGDVLITKDSEQWNDIGVPALVEFEAPDLVCGYHLAILRARPGLNGAFLHRAIECHFIAAQFYVEANGVTRYGLSHGAIQGVAIPLPPPAEQAAIVRFLDHATGRLERAIRAKQKVIALLTEQKQAIIHRAVTRGLDPDVPLRDSGVPWLGEIPEHWEVRRLRHLIKERLTYGANAAAEFTNPDWPRYIRITDFRVDGALKPDTFRSLPPSIASDYMVQPGDILFARSGATVGKAFLVQTLTESACHAGYLIRARPDCAHVHPEYLFAFTQSKAFAIWKDSTFNTATIQNIGADKYANLSIPLPSLPEQETILEFIATGQQPTIDAITRLEREITLLREYKTRLVADVVTGKLDVREAAAGLPEETPLADEGLAEVEDEELEGDVG